MTLFMGMLRLFLSQFFDDAVDFAPVFLGFAQLLAALRGEFIIFAGRAGLGLLPIVIEEPFAANLAEQRIEWVPS